MGGITRRSTCPPGNHGPVVRRSGRHRHRRPLDLHGRVPRPGRPDTRAGPVVIEGGRRAMGAAVTLARPPGATAPLYGCAHVARWSPSTTQSMRADCPARMCGSCPRESCNRPSSAGPWRGFPPVASPLRPRAGANVTLAARGEVHAIDPPGGPQSPTAVATAPPSGRPINGSPQ